MPVAGATDANNTPTYQCESSNGRAQPQVTHRKRQQRSRKSRLEVPGERLLPRDCSNTTGNGQRKQVEPTLSHFDIGYWDGLGMNKVMNVEGSDNRAKHNALGDTTTDHQG